MPHLEPAIFQSVGLLLLVLALVTTGAVIQASLGMGFGLSVAPWLAYLDPALVPATSLWLGLFSAVLVAWRERTAVAWGEIGIGTLGRLTGVGFGMAAIALLTDLKTFLLVFGILTLFAIALSVFGWKMAPSRINIFCMSSVSGLMGIITSVGAPPMALIYAHRPASLARPTLAAFFAIGCSLSLLGLAVSGWTQWTDLLVALILLPCIFLGTWLAGLVRGKFDAYYRPILLIMASSASLLLIWRGLT